MLLSIGDYNFSDIVAYSVTHKDKTKEVENAQGDTTVYVIAEKVTLEVGIGALSQAKLTEMLNAVSSVTFSVTYTDTDGATKTGTFKRSDRVNALMYSLNGSIFWDEQTLTLTQL